MISELNPASLPISSLDILLNEGRLARLVYQVNHEKAAGRNWRFGKQLAIELGFCPRISVDNGIYRVVLSLNMIWLVTGQK